MLADAPLGPEGRPGQPVEELRDVILPQVYRAADLGYIDIERVAVAGQSYGGYCTAASGLDDEPLPGGGRRLGHLRSGEPLRDAAPGDNFPVRWSEKGQVRMGQPPWSDLRRYLDNSPYYRADRIRTPLLIIHGRETTAVPSVTGPRRCSAP